MREVLDVLTVMSVIILKKGDNQCVPIFFSPVSETDGPSSTVLRIGLDETVAWSINFNVLNNYSNQLRDYYRGAVNLILYPPPVDTSPDDPHTCVTSVVYQNCKAAVTKTLDAEVICQLAGSDSNEEVLKPKYQLTCISNNKTNNFLATLRVTPVNEFVPEFSGSLRNVSITELTSRNTVIADLNGSVHDKDCFFGGGVRNITLENGTDWIKLNGTKVVLTKEIRFEELVRSRQTRLWFQLSAKYSGGRVGRGMLIVDIEDVDTHPPYFSSLGCQRLQPQNCTHPFYSADVPHEFTGDVGDIRPSQILAEDGDIMRNDPIRYSFLDNEYPDFVQIDGQTGTVRVVVNLIKFRDSTINFTVVATEDTDKQHHSASTLVLHVITVGAGKDHSTMVVALALSAGFIAMVGVAVVVYLTHRQKKRRGLEGTGQREQSVRESRPMDDLQDQPALAPEETADLTSSQTLEVTESSADPVTFESVSEAISESQAD